MSSKLVDLKSPGVHAIVEDGGRGGDISVRVVEFGQQPVQPRVGRQPEHQLLNRRDRIRRDLGFLCRGDGAGREVAALADESYRKQRVWRLRLESRTLFSLFLHPVPPNLVELSLYL